MRCAEPTGQFPLMESVPVRIEVMLPIDIENISLVWAGEVRVGLVFWEFAGVSGRSVPEGIGPYIDAAEPDPNRFGKAMLKHQIIAPSGNRPLRLPPFGSERVPFRLWMPRGDDLEARWRAAFYVVSNGHRVRWFQVEAPYSANWANCMHTRQGRWPVSINVVHHGRPRVAIEAP